MLDRTSLRGKYLSLNGLNIRRYQYSAVMKNTYCILATEIKSIHGASTFEIDSTGNLYQF